MSYQAQDCTVFARTQIGECKEIEGECLIYDQQRNRVHVLNKTAFFIWELCDGSRSVADIVACVVKRYQVGLDQAKADTAQTLGHLAELELLSKNA